MFEKPIAIMKVSEYIEAEQEFLTDVSGSCFYKNPWGYTRTFDSREVAEKDILDTAILRIRFNELEDDLNIGGSNA